LLISVAVNDRICRFGFVQQVTFTRCLVLRLLGRVKCNRGWKEKRMVENSNDTSRLSWVALGLFIGGLLLPFLIYPILTGLLNVPHQTALNIAAGFGGVCELGGLTIGLAGWRYLPGKVAVIGSGVVISLVVISIIFWLFR
jgi:hypothetical protein